MSEVLDAPNKSRAEAAMLKMEPGQQPDRQQEIIEFLSRPETYGLAGSAPAGVEIIKTHISLVFLAGERAYKLKRAVVFPYLDFRTRAGRKAACEEELRLNRRTAPDLYLKLEPVCRRADGSLSLGGEGEPVDWLVVMRRFDQDMLFDHLAERQELSIPLVEDLACEIYQLHQAAQIYVDRGGASQTKKIITNNEACLKTYGGKNLPLKEILELSRRSNARLQQVAPLLDGRRDEGYVRQCHGDLHLRNIVLIDGRPVLFDGIEFAPDFSIIDTMYDLSFLLMDLLHKELYGEANAVFNRYMDLSSDLTGLACLPLFLSMRAAVRAHVAAAVRGTDDAAAYLDQALAYLEPGTPRLTAIGGLSGTGKSTVAARLAPRLGAAPGALVLRSDAIRKRLAGTNLFEKLDSAQYSEEMTEQVYAAMIDGARVALEGGHTVILDAVYAKAQQREAVSRLARETGVEFQGYWLETPLDVREGRVLERKKNISDASVEIARRQDDYELGRMEWTLVDASKKLETLEQTLIYKIKGDER
ncbi:MAG: AAA family ATPase [Rhodospirillales bacterium]|nr:AAA family ATPase [Rhodospirillales bacterium]